MSKIIHSIFFMIVAFSQFAFADLSDYIVVVKPVYHKTTQETFKNLSQRFEKDGHKELADYFSKLAEEHGHGTGWIYVDKDGENYIITNRHVVNQAEKVNIYFYTADGAQISYIDCPIMYVDDQLDLAVCQFPKKAKKFPKGLELNTAVQKDLVEVVSAGYPGFGQEPVWQIAKGNISNGQVKLDKNYDYLIQHTAPIDPGNSGGPLLIADATAKIGYKLIGVNSWKASGREATNFAIPAKDVLTVIDRAKDSQKLINDVAEKRTRLLRECKIIASEVSSQFPDYTRVYRFISYAMVGEHGFDAFGTVLDNTDDKKEWTARFLDDPVETMRMSLFFLFWYDVKDNLRDNQVLEFKELNFVDSEELASKSEIRAQFAVKDKMKEIVWTLEQGHWRVKSFEMPKIATRKTTPDVTGDIQPAAAADLLEKGESKTEVVIQTEGDVPAPLYLVTNPVIANFQMQQIAISGQMYVTNAPATLWLSPGDFTFTVKNSWLKFDVLPDGKKQVWKIKPGNGMSASIGLTVFGGGLAFTAVGLVSMLMFADSPFGTPAISYIGIGAGAVAAIIGAIVLFPNLPYATRLE